MTPPRRTFLLILLLALFIVPLVLIPPVASRNPVTNGIDYVSTMNPAGHSKELAVRFLLGVLGLSFVWVAVSHRGQPMDLAQGALLAAVVAHIVASVFSSTPLYCLSEAWHVWGLILVAFMICRFPPDIAGYRKVLVVAAITAVICGVYGFLIYLGIDPLPRRSGGYPVFPFLYRKDEARNYIHSFLGNAEYFGGYMAPMAVLCFSRFINLGGSRVARTLWLICTGFLLMCLLLSGSRAPLMGFLLGAAVVVYSEMQFMSARQRRLLLVGVAATLALALAGVAVLSFPNPLNRRDLRLAQRFRDMFDPSSASVRERILFYGVSGSLIRMHPILGHGPGTYRLLFFPGIEALQQADRHAGVTMMAATLQNRVAEHAHCDYLEYWVETGIVGLGAIVLVLTLAGVRFVRLRGESTRSILSSAGSAAGHARELMSIRSAVFAGALCIFFNASFSFPLHMQVRALLAWALLGCFFALDRSVRQLASESA